MNLKQIVQNLARHIGLEWTTEVELSQKSLNEVGRTLAKLGKNDTLEVTGSNKTRIIFKPKECK